MDGQCYFDPYMPQLLFNSTDFKYTYLIFILLFIQGAQDSIHGSPLLIAFAQHCD